MKMNTSSALRLISGIPLLAVFVVATWFLYISVRDYSKVETLRQQTLSNDALSTFIEELGRERGLSAAYLGSGGNIGGGEMMEKQRAKTDAAIKKYKDTLNTKTNPLFEFFSQKSDTVKNLEAKIDKQINQLPSIRQSIDESSRPFGELFQDYFNILDNQSMDLHRASADNLMTPDIAILSQSRINTNASMLNTAAERDYAIDFIVAAKPANGEQLRTWNNFTLNSFIPRYGLLPASASKDKILKKIQDPETQNILSEIAQLDSRVKQEALDGSYSISFIEWFSTMTHKHKIISEVSKFVTESLDETANAYQAERRNVLLNRSKK